MVLSELYHRETSDTCNMQDRRALSETVDSLVIAANAGSDVDWLGRPLPAAMALKQTSAPARHCGHVPRLDFSDLLRVLMAEDFAKYCIHSTRECSEDAHPTPHARFFC